jgi:DNA-binding SARP family transcriptional activator
LLGEFRLWRDHLPLEPAEWKTQKAKALFKILLTEQGRLVLQDRIIEYLWPRQPYKDALNSLWVCVNQLRRTLEPNLRKPAASQFILSRDNGYLFNGAGLCTLDIDELLVFLNQGDAHRAKGELESAIAYYENAKNLYAGDYLEEDLYADWAITRRLELQQAHCHLLKSLAECWAALSQYPKALSYYQKILAKERCREAIWREVMRCYWHLGERDQALLAFEQCKEILRKELKVQPLLPTIELQAKIAQGVIPSSS